MFHFFVRASEKMVELLSPLDELLKFNHFVRFLNRIHMFAELKVISIFVKLNIMLIFGSSKNFK